MARILLVEDEQYIRELYEQLLIEAGYTVDTAADGEEAWHKISEGGYDLVLLDILMPKLDGISILKRLKLEPAKIPNKKIVMLTVLIDNEKVKEAKENGADDYLVKSSLDPDQVVEKVKETLESYDVKSN